MCILVAPDKFKDSLGAAAVAQHIATGLRDVLPEAEIILLPIADGGEGTARVICEAAGGERHSCEMHDPLGRSVRARYGTIANGQTAVMEMSEASGLWRLRPEERDVMRASSFGTGELLLDAAGRGAKEIIIGLGGSATNDGGFGMARALGFRFLDHDGRELSGSVAELLQLARIHRPERLLLPKITAAADVRNPLLGAEGATRTFGPQKGAGPAEVETLEDSLRRLADVAAREFGQDFRDELGTGAAGGLGFGLMTFCGAGLREGFAVVAEQIGLEAAVCAADVIITGEGRLDRQTLAGKAPAGVAKLARRHGKRVCAIVGEASEESGVRSLFDGVYELARPPITRAESQRRTVELLRERAAELARLFL